MNISGSRGRGNGRCNGPGVGESWFNASSWLLASKVVKKFRQ